MKSINGMKQFLCNIGRLAKAKSVAIKSKADALSARLLLLSLMLATNAKKKLEHSQGHDETAHENQSPTVETNMLEVESEDDKYPDFTHSLFEEEEDEDEMYLGDPNASVVDLVRDSKEEEGEVFSLEKEIDHVADLFILKFHKNMRMQKLESFKRYQQLLERSA